MSEISKKVLEEIKSKKIEPDPRWKCACKDYFNWTVFGLAIFVGGVSFGVIFNILSNNDWDIYEYAVDSALKRVFLSMPIVWILFLLVFSLLAYSYFRKTREGYRYSCLRILGLTIIGSVIFGLLLNALFESGERVEDAFARKVPAYSAMNPACSASEIWMQPEKGLLAGKIIRLKNQDNFDLEDFRGTQWTIERSKNVFLHVDVPLTELEIIKIIGEQKAERVFRAIEIRKWGKGCHINLIDGHLKEGFISG